MIREPATSRFLSTLSLRRATDFDASRPKNSQISIHALLAESDSAPRITPTASRNFYPRSPCGERQAADISARRGASISIHALLAESDKMHALKLANLVLFLSTLSLRRATVGQKRLRQKLAISIHALLAESDRRPVDFSALLFGFLSTLSLRRATRAKCLIAKCQLFLSTLSLRRATIRGGQGRKASKISIHALLAESDNMRTNLCCGC